LFGPSYSFKFYDLQLTETHIAEVTNASIRLQEYGVGIFERIATKSALKKAIKKKLIYVNGKVASTATFIYGGEIIAYYPPLENLENGRLKLSLEILYEDDYLAVIHKPAGIVVSGNGFKTIANALGQNVQPSSTSDSIRPQPVHRLDYATTGVLMIGKTTTSIVALNQLFEKKQIDKTYYAVTVDKMDSQGLIDSPIDKKSAISYYQVLETVPSERFGSLNLVQLSPKTGRRHQLRKHMLEIGNPILGDATYFMEGLLLTGKGLYLHAHSLQFNHPILNREMYVTSRVPSKFIKLFPDRV
jgi:23S rRNA pseudouridine1911/1915/1917 synthase